MWIRLHSCMPAWGLRDEQTTLTLHQSIAKIFVYNACVGDCEPSYTPPPPHSLASCCSCCRQHTAVASADLFALLYSAAAAAASRGHANEILIHLRARAVLRMQKRLTTWLGSCHVNPLEPACHEYLLGLSTAPV